MPTRHAHYGRWARTYAAPRHQKFNRHVALGFALILAIIIVLQIIAPYIDPSTR